jgi:polyisoprenoid-binding protein YceI
MRRGLGLVIGLAVLAVVLAGGVYLYITRDLDGPTADVQDTTEQLESSGESESEVVYRISQDESQAQFVIDEVLNGADKTVVGTTSQVAGDILLDMNDPASAEIGEIRINARTFATDDSRRNNAIARLILRAEDAANEFIVFQPTAVTGLPESIPAGEPVVFQVTGDLTIAGETREVTFDVTASLEPDSRLTGSAETTIAYADFGVSIPSVPFVASVGDTVVLRLDFAADAVADPA